MQIKYAVLGLLGLVALASGLTISEAEAQGNGKNHSARQDAVQKYVRGNVAGAQEAMQRILADNPADAQSWYVYAQMNLPPEKAQEAILRAHSLDPSHRYGGVAYKSTCLKIMGDQAGATCLSREEIRNGKAIADLTPSFGDPLIQACIEGGSAACIGELKTLWDSILEPVKWVLVLFGAWIVYSSIRYWGFVIATRLQGIPPRGPTEAKPVFRRTSADKLKKNPFIIK